MIRVRSKFAVPILLVILACPAQCLLGQSTPPWDMEENGMRPIVERFTRDYRDLRWADDIPLSAGRIERLKSFLQEWQEIQAEVDYSDLALDGQIDYVLFLHFLKNEITSIEDELSDQVSLEPLLPFGKILVKLLDHRRQMLPPEPKKMAITLNKLSDEIENNHRIWAMKDKMSKIKKTDALKTVTLLKQFQRQFEDWFKYYNGYDPLFTWWAERPYAEANEALSSYVKFLTENVAGIHGNENDGPIIGKPIGRSALVKALNREMIDYTPEELIKEGEKQYDWCETEMIKASRELGFGDDWLKALDHVKNLHVVPGEQPELIRFQAWEAVEFVESRDLITIPPLAKTTWKMGMMSPERQKVNPFFTGGRVISVSFPANTMTHEDKVMSLRGNNPHFTRATVHHELIPGHHMQFFMTARYKPYRRLFATPFWLEGWPLHWEMLLWDLDFPQSPENRIGMLFWRMHRCARIVFSLSFHMERMSPQECIDYLVDGVGHERANAEAEVRRSFGPDYPPLYQAAYLLGGIQMRALYHEMIQSGKMTPKQFHDQVMRENSLPIVMLRAKLMGNSIPMNFKPHWKFLESK